MNKYKTYKILWIAIIWCWLLSSTYWFNFKTDCEEQTFVVTAYYSPKIAQSFYYKDSFESEKALNWNWTHGASGKPVFNWMLAAPSTYSFWWKIYFPSLWIWEISDRWGAIVNAGEREYNHDRIDIWMWEWEIGLIRALTFGKRTMVWYYCDASKLKSLWINSKNTEAKPWLNFDVIPVMKYFFDATLFIQELRTERTDIRVYKLQEYLMKFGYMDKKTWYFWSQTKQALCNYQLKRWITSRKYCGDFGKRTRYYMKLEAKRRWFLPDFWATTTFDNLIWYSKNYNWQLLAETDNIDEFTLKTTLPNQNLNYFTQAYKKWESNNKIWELQDLLRHYGFYQWEVNNIYDWSTINAVHSFQVVAGILKADDYSNPARGWMWPSTRRGLNQKRNEFQEWKNGIKK
jgi:hypothetical protein